MSNGWLYDELTGGNLFVWQIILRKNDKIILFSEFSKVSGVSEFSFDPIEL